MSERTFIDEATIRLVAGAGGDGAASFERAKFKPKGKPDGGNGGKGGSIILRVDPQISTLREIARRNRIVAERGGNGAYRNRTGRDAEDVIVTVPDGTEVRLASGELLADLMGAGTEFVAARGGRSGRGNVAFTTTRRRSPNFAERGEPGEDVEVHLTLKVLANVGLVGFPNAGKSSLLRMATSATPEVAAYPFTTLTPQLGVAEAAGRIVLADVPGLIEGAAEGRGLGHTFLRHLERCDVLCVVLDPTDPARSAGDSLRLLLDELQAYDPGLAERASVVAINKIDVAAREHVVAAREAAGGLEVFEISATTGDGVPELLARLAELVSVAKEENVSRSHRLIRIRPGSAKATVAARGDGSWLVTSEIAERLLQRFDIGNQDALAYIQDRFDSLGIDEALIEAGARDGDDVVLGNLVFTFYADRPLDDEDEEGEDFPEDDEDDL